MLVDAANVMEHGMSWTLIASPVMILRFASLPITLAQAATVDTWNQRWVVGESIAVKVGMSIYRDFRKVGAPKFVDFLGKSTTRSSIGFGKLKISVNLKSS
jgi:hypothetical protein